jgi:hypothetical protein
MSGTNRVYVSKALRRGGGLVDVVDKIVGWITGMVQTCERTEEDPLV